MTAPKLNYVDYDYNDLVLALQERIKLTDSWKDIYRSSTGQVLIELLAQVLNVGLYYAERRACESYLPTARNLSSMRNLVALVGYVPKRKTSAIGILTFGIASPLTKIVFIPKYTSCQSVNDVKYLTNADVAINVGQTSVSVSSIQGEIGQMEVSASGAAGQEYLINNTNVENSATVGNPTLRVVVDGTEWNKVDSFINSDNTSTDYVVVYNMEGTVTIKFGDNVNGLAPSAGSTINITYVKSAGLDGNVSSTGVITTINSTIYDEDGTAVTVTVTNNAAFLGGDNEEDIEEIRYEAPRVFKTGQRAVSKTDFVSLLVNYPGVADANVWGELEEALKAGIPADVTMLNKVKMSVLLQDWELTDTTFEAALSAYLYNISMLAVKYEFVVPVILDVIAKLSIKVRSGHSLSQTQSDVNTAIANQFVLGDTTKLGTIVKYSQILTAIGEVDGVAYANMTLEILKNLVAHYDSYFDYGVALDAVPILPESARLFVDGVYVTSDADGGHGTGTFSSAGSYTISGTIDYSTGVVLLDISPKPASSIAIRYQNDADGNINPGFNQIARLYDTDIINISME